MKKKTYNKTIVGIIIVVILVVAGITGYVGYITLFSRKGSTELFFSLYSNLPDSFENLYLLGRNAGYTGFQNGISRMVENKPNNIILTIVSNENKVHDYTILIKSDILSRGYYLTLEPGEEKTLNITINPRKEDKWSYNFIEKNKWIQTYEITDKTFIGERIIPVSIIGNEDIAPYTYSPIRIRVKDFGDVLNLNMSIDELKRNPYVIYTNSTVIQNFGSAKREDENTLRLYVKDDKLIAENQQLSRNYYLKVKDLRIYLFKDEEIQPDKTIGFKYQIV